MATHSSIFARRISWTEKSGNNQKGYKELDTTEWQGTNDTVSGFYFLFRVFLYFSKMPKMDGHDFYSKKLLRRISCGQFGKH